MDNNLSALYDVLIAKTQSNHLTWQQDQNGDSLITKVGELLVRVSGISLVESSGPRNAFAALKPIMVIVYDSETKIVARGSNADSLLSAAWAYGEMKIEPGTVEDISSPKIAVLAKLLEAKYRRTSVTSKLLNTLRAS